MPKSKQSKVQSASGGPKSKTSSSRRIKQSTYRSFRISKKIREPKTPLKGSVRLFAAAIHMLIKRWRLFGGIVLVYLVLTVVLVKGFGVTNNIGELKATILELFHGSTAQVITSLTVFSILLGNVNATASDVAGAYQSMLLIVISLVFIWALRQSLAEKKTAPTVRDAFYKGLYPLVPFLLILLVISLQLLPLLFANFLYGVVFTNGLAVTALEQWLWGILLGLLALLTLYMITSSIFALYIVTLPNIRPMQALRSARKLVRYRRWIVMRKVIFLPFAILILAAVVVVPVIIISPGVAEWMFFVLSMCGLAIVHSYLYQLYRELL